MPVHHRVTPSIAVLLFPPLGGMLVHHRVTPSKGVLLLPLDGMLVHLRVIGIWCLMFGHPLLPVHSQSRLLLGGSVWATVVMDCTMSTPHSQDLRWRFMFVWNLGLSVEETVLPWCLYMDC